MIIFGRLMLAFALLSVACEANAQNWPARAIKLIVPTGAGAATDVMARMIADGVSRTIGQPMVVENLPGASGILAHQTVARAPADGYTLLFTNTSGMAINLISFKKLPYDPLRDFAGIALVCNLCPQSLSINADIPATTVQEFFTYARANRGKLAIAFDTTAGAAAFAAKLINKRADLGLIEVPYRSSGLAAQDTASGTTHAMMTSIAVANALVQTGRVRRLAVTSGRRFPALPEVPSLSETMPDFVMDGFFAIVAPAGTPQPILALLNREIGQYLKGAEIQERLLAIGLATDGAGTPESTMQTIRGEQDQWRAIGKELDVEPQ